MMMMALSSSFFSSSKQSLDHGRDKYTQKRKATSEVTSGRRALTIFGVKQTVNTT
jgi:hypothetical protein